MNYSYNVINDEVSTTPAHALTTFFISQIPSFVMLNKHSLAFLFGSGSPSQEIFFTAKDRNEVYRK
jgi:hypothetical protein